MQPESSCSRRPLSLHTRVSRGLGSWLVLGSAAFLLALPSAHGQGAAQPDTTPPSIEYGALYSAVELSNIFSDSKTFPDLVPDAAPSVELGRYLAEKDLAGFHLATFVHQHFSPAPNPPSPRVKPAAPGTSLLEYLASLWPLLRRTSLTVPAHSTLQPEPQPYIVAGDRFRESYYWDSYFTALGLEQSGEHAISLDILKDFAYDLDTYGFVPNGNRSYYLSRSQPPFFSYLVELVARRDGRATLVQYLPELQKEYDYWMRGADATAPGTASRRVVRLENGAVLNRYFDDRQAPRDESYREDVQTAGQTGRPSGVVWQNLRAAAASGWDFSSRWLADGQSLTTVRTLDILPVDLNSLMFHLETTLAQAYLVKGDPAQSADYARRAANRAHAIQQLMWDSQIGAFTDYLWTEGHTTGTLSAATLYPLYVHLASPSKAKTVAATVKTTLLQPGGIVTTPVKSGQQWDAPNGWAPLQWIAVQAFTGYGETDLAQTVATRWVEKNIAGYKQQAELVEKYNVTKTGSDSGGGGGEYATQVGFGWTNGVLIALTAIYPQLHTEAAAAKAPTNPTTLPPSPL